MTPDRARELLGGLAAGILTPAERASLFEAALHDQTLFNEVADELDFAVFLQSPETRAQLANRIEAEPVRRRWWTLRPAWLAMAGVMAASTVLFVVVRHRPNEVVAELAPPHPEAAISASPAPPPATKQPAPPAAKPSAKPKLERKAEPAPDNEMAKASQPADRAEPGTQTQSEQAPAQGAASAGRLAAPMAPRAASVPPPPPEPAAPVATASLTGTVHDASGAVVPGVAVDITNTSTNTTTHVSADANGKFVAPSLPLGGPYTVTAIAPGFEKAQQSGITLSENRPTQIDLPLQVGSMAESVMVAAGPVPQSQNLTQVAVLDFANGAGQNQSGARAADLVSQQLLSNGQVRVIDRAKVQQAAESQNARGGSQSAKDAAALGRSIGADEVIVGSIEAPPSAMGGFTKKKKAAPHVSVTAQIVDTKQARPPVTVSAGGASLQVAASELGDQIQSKLVNSVEGKVTRLDGDIVSVEFAAPPGLAIGTRCGVTRGTRKIGDLTITSVNGQSVSGTFSGASRPRAGDRVTASR